jgi:hypothetical protein
VGGVVLAVALMLAGCTASGTGGAGTLNVSNQTNIPIVLSVNGTRVTQVQAHSTASVAEMSLPALPWHAAATTTGGRQLGLLTVTHEDLAAVTFGPGGSQGKGSRVDLSCGTIVMWVGPEPIGPVGGSGRPGDCGP